ncbi:MAG TPA: glucodextranase DOMON-like domain-containing protein [Actinoplanes sp.]|nr:glucodextranase DOMON-like domain-containing protein [Actinoplanes sp.]
MRFAALALVAPLLVAPVAAAAPAAADGPGALSHFGLARKDCLGTAYGRGSKVWYTVAGGVLSDVYSPTVDNTNVETMQFVVTDGTTFTDLQSRDTTYQVRALDRSGMTCEVTSTARNGKYQLITRYVTDPQRDSVVMEVRLDSGMPLSVYVRLDGSVNGNGGGGGTNGGADSAVSDPSALVQSDPNTLTNAVNRDYAVPNAMALRADRPFLAASSGYVGAPSDGLSQLDESHALTARYDRADHGNVVQTAQLDLRHGPVTLALGFGRDAASARSVAGASAQAPFGSTRDRYEQGWRDYDKGLRKPPAGLPEPLKDAYRLSANVLKASEDKTFPGAVVASLASPWGQAVSAGDAPSGRAVYFGSYREIFARDLYESFTGLLTAGDLSTAQDTVRWLFERQQLPDGRFPRNSLLNGKVAPDSGGDQLDETAYPILMAYQAGLGEALWPRIRKAADFVVAYGPSFGSERWEEQSGYSPSTIAAEIAGLVAAGVLAQRRGDDAAAQVYLATADHFQRSIKGWTVTTSGPYAPRYFIRLSKTGDPNAAISYNLGNGGPDADQRSVVDQGFLELTRLGILPSDDPDVRASLPVVDRVIRTPVGIYRYGTGTAGTEDGYGDCWMPDPTNCEPTGRPWPAGNSGSGHVWPVLSGERAEHHLELGDRGTATELLASMNASTSGIGLVPEQAWENPDLPASPYGTDPLVASIGFRTGGAAGSASPLTWAQSQFVRLALGIGAGRPLEQPDVVAARYVRNGPPGALAVTITGSSVTGDHATISGTTAPGAQVVVAGTPTDIVADSSLATATANAAGEFQATVGVAFLTNVVTVTAALGNATGYARTTVVSEAVPGTTLLDVIDPAGDDHGPGTYAYPLAADFHDGAFDILRFRVIDGGDTVYLLTQLRDLTPTFGSALGAQLLDVFVRNPAASTFSTAPPFASRNFAVAPGSAWSSRIEVQGFAGPVFVDPAGNGLGDVQVAANQATRSILLTVPKAQFGTPSAGWVFTVALHGQDGFSGDQARGFDRTPQAYQFGLCPPGVLGPICMIEPSTAPKVMDTITPPGVTQADVLNPLAPPVELQGVVVP